MNIRINSKARIYSLSNCFVLEYKAEEFFFKSFDLLVTKLFNLCMLDNQAEDVSELVNSIKEFKDTIYGLYAVSGMYPEIKTKTTEFTGVLYGKDC